MRYLVLALTLFCSIAFAGPGKIQVGAVTTNPAANAVLAVTPALQNAGNTGASINIGVTCSSTVAATCAFQVLNASSVVITTINILVPAGDIRSFEPRAAFFIPNGFTLRVISPAAVTGQMQATITHSVEITD